jgi:hypothetical protein
MIRNCGFQFILIFFVDNEEGTIEPKAYQISDQGVAMERDNLLQEGSSIETLAARKGNGKEYIASIIFKDRALNPGEDFIPDELLVKVVAMKPYNPISMFAYKDFPLYGGNKNHAIAYLRQHQNESLHQQLSDFAFLCHLPRFAGLDVNFLYFLIFLSLTIPFRWRFEQQILFMTSQTLILNSLEH